MFVANLSLEPDEVWLNNGSGQFTQTLQLIGASHSNSAVLADIDGDADMDAVVFTDAANRIWSNDGSAFFTDTDQSLGDASTNFGAAGDLDNDGDMDIATANFDSAPNRIWFNTPLCEHHGDVNFNGELTTGDAQLAFMVVMGAYSPSYEEACAADCNGSGEVTVADAQGIFAAALGMGSCVDPIR